MEKWSKLYQTEKTLLTTDLCYYKVPNIVDHNSNKKKKKKKEHKLRKLEKE